MDQQLRQRQELCKVRHRLNVLLHDRHLQVAEGNIDKATPGTIWAIVEKEIRATNGQDSWRCRAVTRDAKKHKPDQGLLTLGYPRPRAVTTVLDCASMCNFAAIE